MALALVSVIAVAALAAALVLLKSRGDLRRQLTAERDELQNRVESLTAANARTAEDADRQRQRADELAVLLEAATTDPAHRPVAGAAGDGGAAEPDDGGLWDLLLAHVARRWAAVVGVPPGNRDMVEGAAADQLAQALGREVERLREEVGVDVELTVAGPVEPQDRVPFLLAAIELLGALASSAERVSVDLDHRLVLVGEGWTDLAGELDAARARAVAAGARVTAVEVEPDRVRLEVTA